MLLSVNDVHTRATSVGGRCIPLDWFSGPLAENQASRNRFLLIGVENRWRFCRFSIAGGENRKRFLAFYFHVRGCVNRFCSSLHTTAAAAAAAADTQRSPPFPKAMLRLLVLAVLLAAFVAASTCPDLEALVAINSNSSLNSSDSFQACYATELV